ncbi:MAG TPA: hypothetical protein VKR59_10895 [Terriglobales bacterium]|nr:hypothetical protein [Terriglobales bacterium]
MRRLVHVLKSAQATHVIDQNCFVFGLATDNIVQQLPQAVAVLEHEATLSRIAVSFCDYETRLACIVTDGSTLIVERILLMFSGHP